MGFIPVFFEFERKNMLPILTVTGIAQDMPGMNGFLLKQAVDLIEMCESKLKGKLTNLMGHENDINIQNGQIAVRFYILFKNDEELKQAISSMQRELG